MSIYGILANVIPQSRSMEERKNGSMEVELLSY